MAKVSRYLPFIVILLLKMKITGQDRSDEFDLIIKDFQEAGLLKPSIIRLEKIAAVDKRII